MKPNGMTAASPQWELKPVKSRKVFLNRAPQEVQSDDLFGNNKVVVA